MSKNDMDPECKVYVGELGNRGTEEEIYEAFSHFGKVKAVWVARKPPGFAYVEFQSPEEALDAASCLNNRYVCGGKIRSEMCNGKSRWPNGKPPAHLVKNRPLPDKRDRSRSDSRASLPKQFQQPSTYSPLYKSKYLRDRSRSGSRSKGRDKWKRCRRDGRSNSSSNDSRSRSSSRGRSSSRSSSRSRRSTSTRSLSEQREEKSGKSESRDRGEKGESQERDKNESNDGGKSESKDRNKSESKDRNKSESKDRNKSESKDRASRSREKGQEELEGDNNRAGSIKSEMNDDAGDDNNKDKPDDPQKMEEDSNKRDVATDTEDLAFCASSPLYPPPQVRSMAVIPPQSGKSYKKRTPPPYARHTPPPYARHTPPYARHTPPYRHTQPMYARSWKPPTQRESFAPRGFHCASGRGRPQPLLPPAKRGLLEARKRGYLAAQR